MIDPTPYPSLNAVLQELVEAVQAVLGSSFVAACLQGSFAVGDFDPHSDVDFIIVVEEGLSEDQVHALQTMHERIYSLDCVWAQHLEGSYFPKDVLRHHSRRGKLLWYLDNGSRALIESDHDNTVVVRCVLLEHGIALAGPHPATLVDPIPVAALRQEILESITDWGQEVLAEPDIIGNRFYQCFAVLHYCRALHDLHTGYVGSKRTGTGWAKTTLDPSWAGLIDRAWDGRPNPALSVRQPADPEEVKRTLEFIEYMLKLSAQYAPAFGTRREQPTA
jgi:predicted nucleotidyltransferase